MSQDSIAGFVLPAPDSSFDAGTPVSSYRALEQAQNLVHLTDEFTQVYVNWMSRDASGHGIEVPGVTAETPTWTATYVHRWLGPVKPSNLVLTVFGHHCGVRARLVPWTTNYANHGSHEVVAADTLFDIGLDLSSSSPTSDSYLHVCGAEDIRILNTAWMQPRWGHVTGSDGSARRPYVCLMRLELQVISEVAARVYGVLLRGCA